jgi:hypothetical protein
VFIKPRISPPAEQPMSKNPDLLHREEPFQEESQVQSRQAASFCRQRAIELDRRTGRGFKTRPEKVSSCVAPIFLSSGRAFSARTRREPESARPRSKGRRWQSVENNEPRMLRNGKLGEAVKVSMSA